MKFVQSFWSKPMTQGTGKLVNSGVWFNKRLFVYGSALSALLLERHYKGNTVFITDRFGMELFVNKLNLGFGEVIVELDELNDLNDTFWAMGKIYAYARMRESFLHFDQDFFLPQPLQAQLVDAPLVAYTSEFSAAKQENIYIPNVANFLNTFPALSPRVRSYCENSPKVAYNAGVMGGHNISIFSDLWDLCLEVVKDNFDIINRNDCHYYNVIVEQFLFTCLAREKNIDVACVEKEEHVMKLARYTNMKFFPLTSSVHVMAEGKRALVNCVYIEEILRVEFPEHYHHINRLLARNQL